MAEGGGGGEVILTDLEEGLDKGEEEVVKRKESGGRFTLGAEDGDELLGEMEFTIRHTQATPYKVCLPVIISTFPSTILCRRISPQSLHFCQMKHTGQVLLLQATGLVSPQVKLLTYFANTIFLCLCLTVFLFRSNLGVEQRKFYHRISSC